MNKVDAHDILAELREDPSLDIPTALDNFDVTDEDQREEITEAIYQMTRHLDAYERSSI
tara:strand:+ start:42 stop:218 length:177 start_codon:yes stop_codon:yes gene_type:complete